MGDATNCQPVLTVHVRLHSSFQRPWQAVDTCHRAGATLPALMKILQYIKRTEDCTACPATPALHLLCDMGLAVAPEVVRLLDAHADLEQVFPGNVPLPSALFRPLRGPGTTPVGFSL